MPKEAAADDGLGDNRVNSGPQESFASDSGRIAFIRGSVRRLSLTDKITGHFWGSFRSRERNRLSLQPAVDGLADRAGPASAADARKWVVSFARRHCCLFSCSTERIIHRRQVRSGSRRTEAALWNQTVEPTAVDSGWSSRARRPGD